MLQRAWANLGACWELARLACLTGLRFKGPYWQWRLHTAFGKHRPPRGEMIASVLEYGRWVRRMRRSGS